MKTETKMNNGFNVTQRGETTIVNVDGLSFQIKKTSGRVYQISSKKSLLTEAYSFQDALNICDRLAITGKN